MGGSATPAGGSARGRRIHQVDPSIFQSFTGGSVFALSLGAIADDHFPTIKVFQIVDVGLKCSDSTSFSIELCEDCQFAELVR